MVEGGPFPIEGNERLGEEPLISKGAFVSMLDFVDSTTVDLSDSTDGVVDVDRVDGALVLRESSERGVVASNDSVDSVVVVDVEEFLRS